MIFAIVVMAVTTVLTRFLFWEEQLEALNQKLQHLAEQAGGVDGDHPISGGAVQ